MQLLSVNALQNQSILDSDGNTVGSIDAGITASQLVTTLQASFPAMQMQIHVTQKDLDEMKMSKDELTEYVISTLDDKGDVSLVGYNVAVTIQPEEGTL